MTFSTAFSMQVGAACVLVMILGFPAPVSAQSVVLSAVMSNASYAPPGSVNEGIALGSIFAAFGTNLAPAEFWQVAAFPIPASTPGGTSIAVTVQGTTVSALPIYTTSSQVGAILPSNCPLGDGTVTVTYKGQTSAAVPIRVVRNNFGIFTQNQQGSGPAVILNVNTETDRPLNTVRAPARPGQVLILWGTGLGPIAAPDGGAPPIGDLPVDIEVWVGGKQASVLYRGRSGCCAGVDQISFSVPDGVAGCYVPLMVKAGGTVSNFASLAIAAAGANCSIPGWSGDDGAILRSASPLRLGAVSFTGLRTGRIGYMGAEGVLARMQPALLPDFGMPAPGSCTVLTARGGRFGNDEPDALYPVVTGGLDAGPVMTVVSRSYGEDLTLSSDVTGHYYISRSGEGYFAGWRPVGYTIHNGNGGTEVKGFRMPLDLPGQMFWTNLSSVGNAISRSQPLRVTWDSETRDGVIVVSGGAATDAAREDDRVSAGFTCTEVISAGEFTIPASILQMLPKAATRGYLTVMRRLTATRFAADGLDGLYFTYRDGFRAGTVTWR